MDGQHIMGLFRKDIEINYDEPHGHHWGDTWFMKNGNTFYESLDLISIELDRFGIVYRAKEKWGLRDEEILEFVDEYNNELRDVSNEVIDEVLWNFPPFIKVVWVHTVRFICDIIGLYQRTWYNRIIQRECYKYPSLTAELVMDSIGDKYIVPNIFGSVSAMAINDKFNEIYNKE